MLEIYYICIPNFTVAMPRCHFLALALSIALAPQTVGAAGGVPDNAAKAGDLPATPETWVVRMLDATRNGSAFKDPAAFAEWLDAITEPRFMTALAAVAIDPSTYPNAMAHAMDPAAARNWSEFTDPQLYLRWMLASVSPSFQQAIITRMTSPDKARRWAEAGARPDEYGSMLARFGNAPAAWMQPAMPMAWIGAMREGVDRQARGQQWLTLPADKNVEGASATAVRYRY